MVRSLAFVLFAVLLVPMLAQEPILPPGIKDTQPPKDIPPTPEEAARRFKVPPGFEVTLFAGEPDVRQPIAMTFDDRGRLWVAECYSYPNWTETGQSVPPPLTKGGQGGLNAGSAATPPNPPFARGGETGQDRILIFEDADGDGRFDKRTVFMDKLPNLTGILWGHGGIWACTAPNLVFIPDKDGDDRPDGPPQIVLDGWSTKTKHNIVNSLAWGPDGWLYGCHGILAESLVGQPGDPPEKRTRMNCGVWRFRPEWKERQEVPQKNPRPVFLPPPLTKGGPGGVAESSGKASTTVSNPPYPPFVRGGGEEVVRGGGNTSPFDADLVERYYAGLDAERIRAATIASAIEINRPVNLPKALRALAQFDGVVREVTDQEIMDAKAKVGAGGLGCEPASAASVAGARKLRQEGVIGKDERVVCILTGHQLKDPTATVAYHSTDQKTFDDVLGHRGVRRAAFANRAVQVPNDLAAIMRAIEVYS